MTAQKQSARVQVEELESNETELNFKAVIPEKRGKTVLEISLVPQAREIAGIPVDQSRYLGNVVIHKIDLDGNAEHADVGVFGTRNWDMILNQGETPKDLAQEIADYYAHPSKFMRWLRC